MSFMKRLLDAGCVRTIAVTASAFAIVFLSWIIIDTNDAIAQDDYLATTYIKIDNTGIHNRWGIGPDTPNPANDRNICQALDEIRQRTGGNFTLIEIEVGGRHHLIIADHICVLNTERTPSAVPTPPKGDKPIPRHLNPSEFRAFIQANNAHAQDGIPSVTRDKAWVGYQYNPQVCRWFDGYYI